MNWGLTLFGILTVQQALLVQCDKVIRVIPEVEAHLIFLRGLENRDDIKIDFWKEPGHISQPVDIQVSDEDFVTLSLLLKTDGIEFKVQIDDVQKLIREELETRGARSGSWHSQYHKLNEINDKLDEVRKNYDHMTSIISLGSSHENRDMRAIEIKGKDHPNKPVFFMECGIHAREWVSPATCMYMIDQMSQKYGNDPSVRALLDKMDFIILPVFNVDGYAYTWTDNRMWRKNRRQNPKGCYGVDLNRNWGHEWGGAGASKNPCHDTYRGSTAFSEVETKNVRDFLKRLNDDKRLKGFIDFHAYSQMWFTPWGYTDKKTTDYTEQKRVAKVAAKAIKKTHGTKFKHGSSAALLYAAAGGVEDWTYGELGVKYSFSVELRDKGRHGFLLPPDQIIPTGEETFEGLKALVKKMKI